MPPLGWLPDDLQRNPLIVWPVLVAGGGYVAHLLWRYVARPLSMAITVGLRLNEIAAEFRTNGRGSLSQVVDDIEVSLEVIKAEQTSQRRQLANINDRMDDLCQTLQDLRTGGRRKFDPPAE